MTAYPRPRRAWRIVRRVVAGLLVTLVVALVAGYWYARPLLLTATGYAAHNECAVRSITGRPDPGADLPPNPLVPYLRSATESASAAQNPAVGRIWHTRTAILGVLAGQDAYSQPGLGCTLPARGDQRTFGAVTPVPAGNNPFTSAPTPTMEPAVAAAVARAFGDDLSTADKQALGTRGIVVVRGGNLVAERYADGFDSTTPQLGWSMTKSVASLLAGRLAQQGKLTLADAYLRPEWTDERSKITIDQLLRMTSGIEWDETYDLGTPITRMLYLEPDMAGYVASLPATHRPGLFQEYSSGSTNVLCSVLQERAGHAKDAPADFPRELLFEPLGLSSAVLEPDATGLPVCSSYLWATPRDWAAIGQFALTNGRWNGQQLLPETWMKDTTTVQPVDQTDDPGYAAGWRSNSLPDGTLLHDDLPKDAYLAQGHDGQRIVVVPSAELVVVRLGFSPGVDDLRVNALANTLATMPRGG